MEYVGPKDRIYSKLCTTYVLGSFLGGGVTEFDCESDSQLREFQHVVKAKLVRNVDTTNGSISENHKCTINIDALVD